MVTDDRFSDFVDPLENYSGLSLFPKTFEVFHASNSDDLDGQLQAIHNHLKSLALRSPDKLREQAKKILDGNSKSLNTKTTSNPAPMGKNEALPALPKVNPRERRPALNLKRARFSLKPNSSHPAVSSEPALDLKKLKNPEEFFMAYERHENAKREILKQIGGNLSDSEQQNTSLIERPRRPGMPGHDKRRSIKYKHLYSCEDSETGKNVPSSQERNDSSILSPIYHSSQEETEQGFTSQETELVGSISKEDHKVDEILDQLLSYNCEDLDGDGALNILQEHLQIKPVELENLQLPDFQEIPKIDLKSSRSGKLPMRNRVLLDVENILKGLSSKTPTKHGLGAESPFSYGASPTPPKSPFASFLLLHQEILRSSLSNDRFSAHDIDQPVRSSSFIESINKEIDFTDERRQSEETIFEKDDNVEVAVIDTSKQDGALNVGSSASHVPVDDNIMNNDMVNSVMNDRACEHDANGDAQANRTNVEDKVQVEDAVQETLLPAQSGLEMMDLALDNSNKQSHLGLGAESPFSYGASPTPPKSPFASFLLLNQKILRSSLSNDRFSAHDIDQPVRSSSFIESINKEIDFAGERRQSEETIFEKDDNVEVAMTDTSKQDGALNVGSSASYVPVDDNIMNNDMDNSVMNDRACEHDANGDAQANRTNVEDKVEDAVQETLLPAQSGLEMMDLALDNSNKQSHLDEPSTASIHDQAERNAEISDNDSEQDYEMEEEHPNMPLDKNHKANRTNVEDMVQVEDAVQETLLPAQSGLEMMDITLDNSNKQSHLDGPSTASIHDQADRNPEIPDNDSEQDSEIEEEHPNMPLDKNHKANGTNVEDKVEDAVQETLLPAQSGLEMMDLALDNSNKQSHLDEPSTASIHDQADRNPKIPDNDSEQDSEMEEEHPNMPLDKNHKATTQSQKSRKRRKSERKSLGGAGTHWESGVRRSTRIRCRPLEYWKGERLLYGRVHRTLPTVIGLKYASPGKGNGALTLKSYVSAEHQDLVELAGLH